MKNIKRTIFITAILGFLLAPNFSSAITVAEIQAQLQVLLQKVQELQNLLSQYSPGTTPITSPYSTPTPPTTGWCHTFNTNLKYGDTGTEITALQIALEKQEFAINQDEKTTSSFGESTASSVVGFQEKYKSEVLIPLALQHGTGYVGTATRTKLNSLYGCVTSGGSSSGGSDDSGGFIGPFGGDSSGPTVNELCASRCKAAGYSQSSTSFGSKCPCTQFCAFSEGPILGSYSSCCCQ